MIVNLSKYNSSYIKVSHTAEPTDTGDEWNSLKSRIKDLCTSSYVTYKKVRIGGGGSELVRSVKQKVFFRVRGDDLFIPIGFSEDFGRYLVSKKIRIDSKFSLKSDLEVLDKWKDRYISYNPVQLEISELMSKRTRAICQVEAGAGKTEIYLGLVESYLQRYPDKYVTIVVPRGMIKSEAESRIKQYEVPSDRIKVITQLGLTKLTDENSKDIREWLAKTGMLIVDEVHHYNDNKTCEWINSRCNPDYLYGFSCTVSMKMINSMEDYKELDVNAMSILSNTGRLISRSIKKSCEFYKYESRYYGIDSVNYSEHLNELYGSDEFRRELYEVVTNPLLRNRKIYIPMPFIDTAQFVFEDLGRSVPGVPIVIIQAGVYRIKHKREVIDKSRMTTAEVVEDFKKLLLETKGKLILIASNVFNEGVSFKELDASILTSSSGWKSTAQILGRSSRGLNINTLFVNFYFPHSGYLNKQSKNREKVIYSEYRVTNRPEYINKET